MPVSDLVMAFLIHICSFCIVAATQQRKNGVNC